MSKFDRMSIAEFELNPNDWGSEVDPKSDWNLASKFATFSHKEACEFIFYIGDLSSDFEPIDDLESKGFSKLFLERCKEVKSAGFRYVCFHS